MVPGVITSSVILVSVADILPLVLVGAVLGGLSITGFFAMRLLGAPRDRHKKRGRTRRSISTPTLTRHASSGNGREATNGGAPIRSGWLRIRGGDGRAYALGTEPAIIGTSDTLCTIVLAGEGIAPEHARVWLQQSRFLLHHVGGLSRKTYVGGQEADWVVLEAGDEVSIGNYRLVFEDVLAPQTVVVEDVKGRREQNIDDDLARMEAAVRDLWAEARPASETAVGERSGTGKFKVHRRKEELAKRVSGTWVKRGRTVVLER
jgi:hypothetical protein